MSTMSNMPTFTALRAILADHELFMGLSDAQFEALLALMQEKTICQGEFIVQEGELAEDVYIIAEGEAEVLKQEPASGVWHRLNVLSAGECIGEVALLDNGPRSASVRAISDCVVAQFHLQDLQIPPEIEQSSAVGLRLHFAKRLSQRLRTVSGKTVAALEAQVAEAKARVALGVLLCTLLVLNSGYVLVLQIATTLSQSSADTLYVSLPLIVFFAIGMFLAIKHSGYPLSMYGLTTKNWRTSVIEAVILTLPVLLLIVFVKWLLIRYNPAMQSERVFDWSRSFNLPGLQLWLIIAAYATFSAVQEIIVRGGIQSSFQHFLVGKHRRLIAILMANLMYSLSHLHLSVLVAFLVFLPGLFWGWLYARHRTVLGVCVSHVAAGIFLFYVVGLRGLLH